MTIWPVLQWLAVPVVAALQPMHFAALLQTHLRVTLLALGGWYAVLLLLANLSLLWVGAFSWLGMVVLAITSLFVPTFLSSMFIMSSGSDTTVQRWVTFWLLRSHVTIAPTMLVLMILLLTNALPESVLILLIMLLGGLWFTDSLHTRLLLTSDRTMAQQVRSVLTIGAISIGGLLLWSPVFRTTDWVLLAVALLGGLIALLRPLAWIGERCSV
ncbi:MAG: hypothetical protein HC876_21410 [Chloroflexaceae bacterium]|nr:hypothetical protein [Chloroflexaceae bacterium]